jgi:hypothetical protein
MISTKELESQYGMTSKEVAELIESADDYARGDWPEGKITHVGRPSLATEEVRPVTVRLPISQIRALDGKAQSYGETRSAAVREAVGEWLMRA